MGTVASYFEKHHPNKTTAMRAIHLLNDNVVLHFQKILKPRQKQMSLDSFLVKKNWVGSFAIKEKMKMVEDFLSIFFGIERIIVFYINLYEKMVWLSECFALRRGTDLGEEEGERILEV